MPKCIKDEKLYMIFRFLYGFFEIYGVSLGQGVEPVRTREEGVNFSQFWADVLHGRSLIVWSSEIGCHDMTE